MGKSILLQGAMAWGIVFMGLFFIITLLSIIITVPLIVTHKKTKKIIPHKFLRFLLSSILAIIVSLIIGLILIFLIAFIIDQSTDIVID